MPDIFSVWNTEGWLTPEVDEHFQPDRTILKLSFVRKEDDLRKGALPESPNAQAESPNPRAESPNPRAESPNPGAESPKARAESPNPRAESPFSRKVF